MTATRFLWAGADSSIHALVDGQVAALEEFGTQEERSAFTEHIIDYFLLLFPFSFMLSQAISGSLLRVWGKGTNSSRTRFRRIRSSYEWMKRPSKVSSCKGQKH